MDLEDVWLVWRSRLDGCSAISSEGGHGFRRCLAETWCADGALLYALRGKKDEADVCPKRRVSPVRRDVQSWEKLGRGTVKLTFFNVDSGG